MHLLFLILGQRNLLVRETPDAPWYNHWQLSGTARKEQRKIPLFRPWSQQWLNRWQTDSEATRPLLQLAMLPQLLEAFGKAHDLAETRLVLFQTDQSELFLARKKAAEAAGTPLKRDFSQTDTCYLGPLVVDLLREAYPELSIEAPRSIPCDVGDINELARYFRQELSQYKQVYPQARVTVAEAGGAGQIKTSLFLVSEFFFDQQHLQRFIVREGDSNVESEVEQQNPFEFRRIILGEQILGLLRPLAYEGANALIPQVEDAAWKGLRESLRFAQDRKQLLYDAAEQHARHLLTSREHAPEAISLLRAYAEEQTPWPCPDWLGQLFSPRAYFQLCEQLILTHYYLQSSRREFTEVVLSANQFIEGYLNALVEEAYSPSQRKQLDREVMHRLKTEFNWKYPNAHSLPYKLLYAEPYEDSSHQEFLADFKALNSRFTTELSKGQSRKYALDKVRNLIAHEGRGVSKETFDKIPQLRQRIERWYRAFGLPEENPYVSMNRWLEAQLKELAEK